MARHWHFLSDLLWIAAGLVYLVLLFVSGHWSRIVPTTWHIVPEAWATFVYYSTFHLPPEPDGFYRRNMNHIVLGTDDTHPLGLILGLVGITSVVAACFAAYWLSWNRPRSVQVAAKHTAGDCWRGD